MGVACRRRVLRYAAVLTFASDPAAGVSAFPGAEGFGAETVTGGRGGAVLIVNTLDDVDDGSCDATHCSFREALRTTGPRVVVFSVAGEIALHSQIPVRGPAYSDLTVAGQTAPGGGIVLRSDGALSGSAIFLGGSGSGPYLPVENVILRFLTIRPGPHVEDSSTHRAVTIGRANRIIVDHLSMSWSTDQINASGRNGGSWTDVCWQWNIFSEGLARPDLAGGWGCHPDYCGTTRGQHEGHSKGVHLTANQDVSFHHNLIALHQARAPRATNDGDVEYINNVHYGIAGAFNDTAVFAGGPTTMRWNIVGNYYKKGPESIKNTAMALGGEAGQDSYYVSGNRIHDVNGVEIPNSYFAFIDEMNEERLLASPHVFPRVTVPVTETPALQAVDQVLGDVFTANGLFGAGSNARLDCAGNWVERRDAVDARIIRSVREGTGGVIDLPSQVGGWPPVDPGTPCPDIDRDGMPDAFEDLSGFDKADPSDARGDADGDGYTNLEEYLNGAGAAPGRPLAPALL